MLYRFTDLIYIRPEITFWQFTSRYESLIGFYDEENSQLLSCIFNGSTSDIIDEYSFPEGSGPPTCMCTVGPLIVVCCNVPTTNGVDRIHVFRLKKSLELEKLKCGSIEPSTDMSVYYSSIAANESQILVSVYNSDRLLVFNLSDFVLDKNPLLVHFEPAMENCESDHEVLHPASSLTLTSIRESLQDVDPIIRVVSVSRNGYADICAYITKWKLCINPIFNVENVDSKFEFDPPSGDNWTHLAIGDDSVVYACSMFQSSTCPTITRIDRFADNPTTKTMKLSCLTVTAMAVTSKGLLTVDDLGVMYFLSLSSLEILCTTSSRQIGEFVSLGLLPYDQNAVFGAIRSGWCTVTELEKNKNRHILRFLLLFIVIVSIAVIVIFYPEIMEYLRRARSYIRQELLNSDYLPLP